MRKLKILCLLATLWLMVGACKKNECGDGRAVPYGHIRMYIEDELGRNYIYVNKLPIDSIVVYDSTFNYATTANGIISWEQERNKRFDEFRQIEVDFAKNSEAIGVMHAKTFYVKLNKDIDTLKVNYKLDDKCMNISNFKAYYNDNLVYTGIGVPTSGYDFTIVKK